MQITIHRGLNQIGGCITEISTETSRVFIDFGQNLPGVGEETTREQDEEMVKRIFAQNKKEHEAVFYTHAHEDHVGLFKYIDPSIPQYIGEGGKEMLIAKYKLIKVGHEKALKLEDDASNLQDKLSSDEHKLKILKLFKTWERTKHHDKPKSKQIGDISITPFYNCHSIYDSYMFLIEDGKERIWHMGDYRKHGYMGKGLFPVLSRYAKDIDVLITEGTMLKRDDICIHESVVAKKMAAVMTAFKYVVVLTSATDIERLASIKEAAKTAEKELVIYGGFMRRTMEIFTRREGDILDGFFRFRDENNKPFQYAKHMSYSMKKNGFVLVTGVHKHKEVKELLKDLNPSEVLLIFSTWDGYYKDAAQVAQNSAYKDFRDDFSNVVDIHTPGHADRRTIQRVVKTVNAKKVICIHKEADAEL